MSYKAEQGISHSVYQGIWKILGQGKFPVSYNYNYLFLQDTSNIFSKDVLYYDICEFSLYDVHFLHNFAAISP
jgi:hypothetical protein